MSGTTEAIDHVAGILLRNDYKFDYADGGRTLQLSFPKSLVRVRAVQYRDQPTISIYANLVNDVPLTEETKAGIFFWANQRNTEAAFVRFFVDDYEQDGEQCFTVVVEWELAARDLQANEFLIALEAVAEAGESWADELMSLFGGENFETFRTRVEEEAPDGGGD